MAPSPITAMLNCSACGEDNDAMPPWSGRTSNCQMVAAIAAEAIAIASIITAMVVAGVIAALARAARGHGAAIGFAIAVGPGGAIRAEISLALRRCDRRRADKENQRHNDFCRAHDAISLRSQ